MSARSIQIILLFLLPACQVMPDRLLGIEGRAIVLEDTSIDGVESGSSFDQESVDVSAYGAQVSLNLPIVDVLGSLDWRRFEDEDTPELNLGLRRRIFEIWRLHPYIEANFRYGFDLDNGISSEDYTGYSVGVGAMLDVTDNLFANVRVMYEGAEIDLPSNSVTADGVIATVGFGFFF